MNKWIKKLTAALCAAVLMCGMAGKGYAGGGGAALILWSRRQPKLLTPVRASPRTATL